MKQAKTSGRIDSENYELESKMAGWDSPARVQDLVKEFITEGTVVLDIGTGTGLAIQGYSHKGVRVIALDNNMDMLTKASPLVGRRGEVRLTDMNKPMPLSDLETTVDVAQAVGVLEFASDIRSVFEQIYTTLNTGGVFVFTIESADTENTEHFPESNVIVYRHKVEYIVTLLKAIGFIVLRDTAYTGYLRGKNNDKVSYHIFLTQKQ